MHIIAKRANVTNGKSYAIKGGINIIENVKNIVFINFQKTKNLHIQYFE